MSNPDQVSQLLSQALKILQENNPYAAEEILSRCPESARDNMYYRYIAIHIYRLTRRIEEAKDSIDALARMDGLAEDVILNILPIAVELEHQGKDLNLLAGNALSNPNLQAVAARYLLSAGQYAALLNASKKFTADEARYCAVQAAVFAGKYELAPKIAAKIGAVFRRQPEVAALLLSVERLAAWNLPAPEPAGPRKLVVITPLGPGHQAILEECRGSVAALKLPEGWTLEHLVVDDSAGRLGRSAARNQGIRQAREQAADWLFFLDADDLIAADALERALPCLGEYKAVWGLIASFQQREAAVNRMDQLPFIDDVALLLAASPFRTLQMGLFVDAELAAGILFDESMNCGEDFRFYHELWRRGGCIKLPFNFLYNRRGLHSTGPRAASGAEWKRVTEALTRERIDELEGSVRVRQSEVPLAEILRHRAIHYLGREFSARHPARTYAAIFVPSARLRTPEFAAADTRWFDVDTLAGAAPEPAETLLVDLRYSPQRFFDVAVMQGLSTFERVDVLAATEAELAYFRANLPGHRVERTVADEDSGALLMSLSRHRGQAPRFIFIAGFSRSGSTMAYNMLSTTVRNYRFFDREVPVYQVMHTESSLAISKRPLDIFDLARIFASPLAQETALLVCYRDPRAMLTSRHRGVSDDYFMGYDKTWFLQPDGEASYTNPGVIDTHNTILNALRQSTLHSVTPLRYEDLVLRTEATQAFLGDLFGLDYEGAFTDFHKQELGEGLTAPLNDIRAVDASSIDKWRAPEHRDRLATQFARCPALNDVMAFYGYRRD